MDANIVNVIVFYLSCCEEDFRIRFLSVSFEIGHLIIHAHLPYFYIRVKGVFFDDDKGKVFTTKHFAKKLISKEYPFFILYILMLLNA